MSLLPSQPTRFIGREDDLAKITAVLHDPTCRLITLVGQGGIGKTRLAIEVGARLESEFANGVYFINLAALTSATYIPSAIAKDLQISLFGLQDLDEQMVNFLRHKETLLILDNFDQLLDGATFLTTLLDNAPALKIIVTSREVLNLRQEWVWSVTGMQYPDMVSIDNAAHYGAVVLFQDCARRVRPNFRFEDEKAHIIRICQLVEGMPLAIELAASWLKVLSCAEIATEIARNMNFLNTNLRDLPERHRSIQVVFDHSWQLLADEERGVFARLSIFGGSFKRESAEAITGASLMTLSTLLDKSLLQHDANGRYQLHSLLRQYAANKLAAEAQTTLNQTYTTYYGSFLEQLEPELLGGRQQQAIDRLTEELDNALAGWMSLVDSPHAHEQIRAATSAIAYFYEVRGRQGEIISSFEAAYQRVKVASLIPNQIVLLTYLCWMYIGSARYGQAKQAFVELEALYAAKVIDYPLGHGTNPHTLRTILTYFEGDYPTALAAGETALQTSQQRGDKRSELRTLQILSSILIALGDYEQAYVSAQRGYEMALSIGDLAYAANCISSMGTATRSIGKVEQALYYYEEAYRMRKIFGNPYGIALALFTLGNANHEMADDEQALSYLYESASIYRELHDERRLAGVLQSIGDVFTTTAQYHEARTCYLEVLDIVTAINMPPQILWALTSVGKWLLAVGNKEAAVELLQFVVTHPAVLRTQRDIAQKALREVPEAQSGSEQSSDHTPQTAAAFARRAVEGVTLTVPTASSGELLLDPLTERELEVLRYLADGLTNQEIAERLVVVLGTIKSHNHSIFSKLYVKNRVQAIARAHELQLI